jgi:molybdenum cofactor cytidylyltransferase
MLSENIHTGIVILAAGTSARMGRPKQLLPYKGKTLLQHALDEARSANASAVVVVFGAMADVLLSQTDTKRTTVVINNDWQEGMASSIRAGVSALLKEMPAAEAAILMLCDQPFVSANVLDELISTNRNTGKPIIASNYGDVLGPPALFHKSFFTELMLLEADAGARKIIQQHQERVATVFFPGGHIDIDRMEDYDQLLPS